MTEHNTAEAPEPSRLTLIADYDEIIRDLERALDHISAGSTSLARDQIRQIQHNIQHRRDRLIYNTTDVQL